MADSVSETNFPVSGLLPKKETGVTAFLNKYPEYDGRGITIAIFDSGVDPGAPGLEITSDGKPKVIERFDCSGAGDVDTSTVVEAKDGEIVGLSGRKLKIPEGWVNPTGKFHIGIKNGNDLYPSKVVERVSADRKEKCWDPIQKVLFPQAMRDFQQFESKHAGTSTLSAEDKLLREDLENKVELLLNLDKKYTDPGSIYDCVLFHDGTIWRACIDTSECGKLASGVYLAEYSKTREFAPLTAIDQLSVSINVHNEGNILEIVGMCSSHGTHVASIASAYFPDDPERCGLAPGAQIVSLTIGDGRLGSMETGTAIIRAMIKVMELNEKQPVHLINMSYGEHAHFSNAGRIGELMNEVVNKYGVVWVASAGNHGPALCTVGTPPDISQATLIGVGAYVSPDMMVAEYSLRQKLPGMPYTWSSRGPTIDGDIGVTICAPGGAITSVPAFTFSQAQLMNGTSMAAPHVTGAIGILLSGMIAKGLPYSPYSVKRALENSATYLPHIDPYAQGHGLLNVERSFEHLTKYHDAIERDIRFNISCGVGNQKGIHLRCGVQDRSKDIMVSIEPCFKDDKNTEAKKKIEFGVRLALVCDASWITCASFLDLCNSTRSITVRVDGSGLPTGIHNTCIKAYDTACVEKGHLFRINITLVQPVQLQSDAPKLELTWNAQHFPSNTIKRHFVLVPELATIATLKLKCQPTDKGARFIIHCMQIRPLQSCKSLEYHKMLNVLPNSDLSVGFPCKPSLILEIAIAKYWANSDDVTLDYSLEFRGVQPDSSSFTMYAADGLFPIEIRSLRNEEVCPSISLKNTVQTLRPSESKLSPLTSRDVIPPSRQIFELILLYNFHIPKFTEVSPNLSLLSDLLYESEFESQLWMLYDSNKALICCGDAYPSKYTAKLEKGDYVIRLSIRHEKRELLERLNDSPILLSQKLATPISLDLYASQTQGSIGGKKLLGFSLQPGLVKPVYVAPVYNEKVMKGATIGQYLSGTISFVKDELGKKADTYPFKYILPEPAKKNGTKAEKDKDKTKWEEYCDAVRDVKTNWLSKLESVDESTSLYNELIGAYPDHLTIHTAMLQSLEPSEPKKLLPMRVPGTPECLDETQQLINRVLEITNIIIKAIDQEKLLAFYGLKSDNRPDAAKIKTAMDRQKSWLLEALNRRGISYCRLYLIQQDTCGNGDHDSYLEEISNIWRDVLKFVDPTDNKVIYFSMWHAVIKKHYGRFIKYLLKLGEDKPCKEIDDKVAEYYRLLNWTHAANHVMRCSPNKYPSTYRPF